MSVYISFRVYICCLFKCVRLCPSLMIRRSIWDSQGCVTTKMASVPGRYDVGSYIVDCGLLALLINLSSTSIALHRYQSSHAWSSRWVARLLITGHSGANLTLTEIGNHLAINYKLSSFLSQGHPFILWKGAHDIDPCLHLCLRTIQRMIWRLTHH